MSLPSLGPSRHLSTRSICAANLRGTAQSLNVYAADNADAYPIISPTGGYSLASGGTGTPSLNPEPTILSMYAAARAPSVTQNMWLLVLTGQVAPRQFICRDDPAQQNPNPVSASATIGNDYQTNFNDGRIPSDLSYSYSFAYPWESTPEAPVGTWWKSTTDASLPLISDMAPFAGTGKPAATPAHPSSPNANSFNHGRNGQNIGYGDAHAEFSRNPAAGHLNDNIFTYNSGIPSEKGTAHRGTTPNIGTGGTPGAYDICLVPAADGNAHARK